MVINIPIQALSDRFAMADVYGKRLIAIGDQRKADVEDSSIFKQITGGDALRIEKKGKDSFNFLFNGALVMACNGLPGFVDDKGGHVFERMELMECKNVIATDKRDPLLFDKICGELDGVFLWALEGLNRLLANNYRFTSCKRNEEAVIHYRSTIDTVFAFIDENCEVTGDTKADRIKKTTFEDNYTSWCLEKGMCSLERKNIQRRAEKNGIECAVYHGYLYYKGLRYKETSKFYILPEQIRI